MQLFFLHQLAYATGGMKRCPFLSYFKDVVKQLFQLIKSLYVEQNECRVIKVRNLKAKVTKRKIAS